MTINPQNQVTNTNSSGILWALAFIILLGVTYFGYNSYQKMPHSAGDNSASNASVLVPDSKRSSGAGSSSTNNDAALPNLNNESATPSPATSN